eukprot:scaffold133839_cov32-Tisochrysis_lutea.AAC.4
MLRDADSQSSCGHHSDHPRLTAHIYNPLFYFSCVRLRVSPPGATIVHYMLRRMNVRRPLPCKCNCTAFLRRFIFIRGENLSRSCVDHPDYSCPLLLILLSHKDTRGAREDNRSV